MHVSLVTIVIDDYDEAILYFCDVLGFELIDDSPSVADDGTPKRWVEVRPPGAQTGFLLAQARGRTQEASVGNQAGGRVGFFLTVDDFESSYQRMLAAGVDFEEEPRSESYGMVVKFRDLYGNRWDLFQPAVT